MLFLNWDIGAIVVLYWAENLVIGMYTVIKLFIADGIMGLFSTLFFTIHYGAFCGAHGIFVLQLTGFAEEDDGMMDEDSWPGPLIFIQLLVRTGKRALHAAPDKLIYAVAALVLSHGISFLLNYIGGREFEHNKTSAIMMAPYKRIMILHIAIIAGGFLVLRLGSPIGLLLALVALKIGMDIMLHRQSHKALHATD